MIGSRDFVSWSVVTTLAHNYTHLLVPNNTWALAGGRRFESGHDDIDPELGQVELNGEAWRSSSLGAVKKSGYDPRNTNFIYDEKLERQLVAWINDKKVRRQSVREVLFQA